MYSLNSNTAVICDFHLKLNDTRFHIIEKFFNEVLSEYENILILGDFFDFFYTFPEVSPTGYFDILMLLKNFSFKKKIFYIEGNHDFNLRNFFNIQVFPEKFFFKMDNKIFLAVHGDTIDKNDKRYRFLRKFLRSTIAKILMDNLPPYIILKIAKHLSGTSEKYLRKKEDTQHFKNFFYKSELLDENFDFLISGHFHINDVFEIKNKKFYLLAGIEHSHINYLEISNKGVEYKKWKY